ncbi:MAG: PIN domain-containing protein [Chthoniobacteraceae bacterium]
MDTGPLVAFLTQTEALHDWVASKFAELPAPFVTCEPVLAETFFLLSRLPDGPRRFFDLLGSGLLEIEMSVLAEQAALGKLIHKYKDLPMSLADACLVRLAELHPKASVFTLDTHFRVYRKHGRQQIPVMMP